jgi:hypothetical protein
MRISNSRVSRGFIDEGEPGCAEDPDENTLNIPPAADPDPEDPEPESPPPPPKDEKSK